MKTIKALNLNNTIKLLIISLIFLLYLYKYNFLFLPYTTYIHELGHGLAALITNGKIVNININFNGSGHCSTIGGNRFAILIMGYLFPSMLSILFLYSNNNKFKLIVYIKITIITFMFYGIFFSENIRTFFLSFFSTLIIVLSLIKFKNIRYFIYIISSILIIDNFYSISYLLKSETGDHVDLYEITKVNPIFWIYFWFLINSASLLIYLKK